MSSQLSGAYFTIDVDAQPTIVFHADRFGQARELAREQWLRQDLCQLKSNGKPVCTTESKLTARRSTHDEIAAFVRGCAVPGGAEDEIIMAYLVHLDAIPKCWKD
jgi:hypothetical protein